MSAFSGIGLILEILAAADKDLRSSEDTQREHKAGTEQQTAIRAMHEPCAELQSFMGQFLV